MEDVEVVVMITFMGVKMKTFTYDIVKFPFSKHKFTGQTTVTDHSVS